MVHLSVAVGRFFEALLFAIAKAAGLLLLGAIGVAIAAVIVWRLVRRKRRLPR